MKPNQLLREQGKSSRTNISLGIFPSKLSGEYFPSKIFGGIFFSNSQVSILREPHKWISLSADTGSVSNIAGFVQVCRFSAFLQVAGKSLKNGKMF